MGSWDAYRPKSLRRPRPVPSVLYYILKYHGKRAATYSLLQNLPPSLLPYRLKKYRATYFAGLLLTILLLPLVVYQVRQAWREASKMLRQGEKIPFLNHHDENIGHIV
jgi:ABC-type phosphate transport system permease subunit